MTENNSHNRYHRQVILKEFGLHGQQKLADSKVLIIGAGGLGCPVISYLAAAGVGTLGIIDNGLVELSNLHRQVIYKYDDIGKPKVTCAKAAIDTLQAGITVDTYNYSLTASNAIEILNRYDVIIDGTDNFATRYMINDACTLLGKPLVYGAVSQFEGQVALFYNGINYRDIFPHPPKDHEVLNCEEAGVLGVLPGIIGSLMAAECLKLLTGIGDTLSGKLLTYSAFTNKMLTVTISSTEQGKALLPNTRETFEQTDYVLMCSAAKNSLEIDAESFYKLLRSGNAMVIDVREHHETPTLPVEHRRMPLSEMMRESYPPGHNTVVFVCQSGKRSLIAAQDFVKGHNQRRAFSLKGGVNALTRQNI